MRKWYPSGRAAHKAYLRGEILDPRPGINFPDRSDSGGSNRESTNLGRSIEGSTVSGKTALIVGAIVIGVLFMGGYFLNSLREFEAFQDKRTVAAPPSPVVYVLGTRWDEQEQGIPGTWVRRGTSNIFDVTQPTIPVTTVNRVTISGNKIFAERIKSSDGNLCDYEGTFSTDGRTVAGTYNTKGRPKVFRWSATIIVDPPTN